MHVLRIAFNWFAVIVGALTIHVAAAGEVALPGTDLHVEMSADLQARPLSPSAPDIVLYYADAGENAAIQAVRQAAGLTAEGMAAKYEQLMAQAFATFRQTSSDTRTVGSLQVLRRTYAAAGGGQNVSVETLFIPHPQQGMILHAICQPHRQAAMTQILQSLRGPQATHVQVPGTSYRVALPANWQSQHVAQDGNESITIMPADGTVAVNLAGAGLSGIPNAPELLRGAMSQMGQGLQQQGYHRVDQKSELTDSRLRLYERYQGSAGNVAATHVIAIQQDGNEALIVNAMYPDATAATHGRTIQQLIDDLAGKPAAAATPARPPVPVITAGPPATPAVAAPTTPGVPPPTPTAKPTTPAANGTTRVSAPGFTFSFEAPADWAVSAAGNKILVTAPADHRAGLSFSLQRLTRRPDGKHADLATSVATALELAAKLPEAEVVGNAPYTIAGQTGHMVTVTYRQDNVLQRMNQVLLATPESIYWLGYTGSDRIAMIHQALFSHALKSAECPDAITQTPVTTTAPAVPSLPAAPTGYHWFTEETSGLRWHTPSSWPVEKIGANPTLLPPAGDALADAGGIKIQNLDRTVDRYQNLGSAVKELMAFISQNRGTVLNMGEQTIHELKCHVTEFTVSLNEESHHMWFIHVERPQTIALLQYDACGTVFTRAKLAQAMRPHVNAMMHSLHEAD